MTKILLSLFVITSVLFFIYSFGFVDFNLTLSSHPAVMGFVGWTQSLAMFHRSASVNVYIGFLVLMYILYVLLVRNYAKSKSSIFPWKWVCSIAIVLTLAYPLLSSDVFKYLFSARMVIDYHVNPNLLPPNTFPDDTWIRFMRWVHTPSPYGPVMTGLAIPPYILGLKKFVPALFLDKLMQLGWYLLSVWLVGKLSGVVSKDKVRVVVSQLFFALNPLIMVEWLTNAHNDAPMISLMLLSLYLMTLGKKVSAFLTLALSVGIKFVTVIFVPFLFLKKINIRYTLYFLLTSFTLAPLLYHYSFQYQPWYVTWIIPFAAILGSPSVMWIAGAYTVGSFLRYLPFIGTGFWEGSPMYFAWLSFGPPVLAAAILLIRKMVYQKG